MKNWTVTAIQVGYIRSCFGNVMRYSGSTEPLNTPIWCIAATDGTHKVLIDTGIDELDWIHAHADPMIRQDPGMETCTAIKRFTGWNPEEVSAIINTHLHFDHCGCNRYFPNAHFYVQRKEYESAFLPSKPTAHLYGQRFFDKHSINYFRWTLLEGEAEILPGLLCLPTPGHTYGHQSVLLHTGKGTVCAAGDAVSVIGNIQENREPAITVDTQKELDSLHAIRIRADFIIPGHEPSIVNGTVNSFPEISSNAVGYDGRP